MQRVVLCYGGAWMDLSPTTMLCVMLCAAGRRPELPGQPWSDPRPEHPGNTRCAGGCEGASGSSSSGSNRGVAAAATAAL
jgi:hypothetical protein